MKNAPFPLRGVQPACYNDGGKGAFLMRNRCWPVLLGLWPYAGIAMLMGQALGAGRGDGSWTPAPLIVWAAGLVFVCGLNFLCALCKKEGHARTGMIVKLVLIPYYAASFLFGGLLVAAPPAMLLMVLLNGLLLLASSSYSLRGIYLCWRKGTLKPLPAAVLAATQLIFVLDVPGAVALYAMEKRRS